MNDETEPRVRSALWRVPGLPSPLILPSLLLGLLHTDKRDEGLSGQNGSASAVKQALPPSQSYLKWGIWGHANTVIAL